MNERMDAASAANESEPDRDAERRDLIRSLECDTYATLSTLAGLTTPNYAGHIALGVMRALHQIDMRCE